ncbi:MAG: ATP-dependent chaperone ClpB, partial [Solibacillus isronensis]
LNRMDDIIMFHALSNEHFHKIAWKYVKQLQDRVAEQEITLSVDAEVVDWIVKHGIDPQFGARPLKRFVQRHLETIVARELLKGEVTAGGNLS